MTLYGGYGGGYGLNPYSRGRKTSELDRLDIKMRQLDRQMVKEAKSGYTLAWRNMKKDMVKLKDEYEKLKGGGKHDPTSMKQGEAMVRKNVLDTWLGRRGKDSHSRMED